MKRERLETRWGRGNDFGEGVSRKQEWRWESDRIEMKEHIETVELRRWSFIGEAARSASLGRKREVDRGGGRGAVTVWG